MGSSRSFPSSCSLSRPSNVVDTFEQITSVKCPIIPGTIVSGIILTLVPSNFILQFFFYFRAALKKLILLSWQREIHFNLQNKRFLFSIPEYLQDDFGKNAQGTSQVIAQGVEPMLNMQSPRVLHTYTHTAQHSHTPMNIMHE